jgi:hypothetical protein
MAATHLSPRQMVRAVRHLAAWAGYHSRGGTAPSRRPARVTHYASAGKAGSPAREKADEDAAQPRARAG